VLGFFFLFFFFCIDKNRLLIAFVAGCLFSGPIAVAILQTVMEKGYFSPSTNTKRFKDSEDDFYTFSDMKNLPISYLDSIDSKPPARDSSLSVSPGSAAIFEWPAEIDHLVREMRDERDGVPIRDRRLTNAYTKTTQMHPRCFLGGEAVEWLVGRTRRLPRAEDARHAMNVLLSGNIMYDISTLDTGLPFSEKRFYRFREDANDQPAGASQQVRSWMVFYLAPCWILSMLRSA
jgi:hypothetical protein